MIHISSLIEASCCSSTSCFPVFFFSSNACSTNLRISARATFDISSCCWSGLNNAPTPPNDDLEDVEEWHADGEDDEQDAGDEASTARTGNGGRVLPEVEEYD